MRIELTLKNYRCFPDSSPARIVLDDGNWTAFVGVNNAGKSTLLRFFYEFRPFFELMADAVTWRGMANGEQPGIRYASSVKDPGEVSHNQNERPIGIEFRITDSGTHPTPHPTEVVFEIRPQAPANCHLVRIALGKNNNFPPGNNQARVESDVLRLGDVKVNLAPYLRAMARLARTFYVGPFRNALNTGAKETYFDIQVGDAFIRRWREMQTGNNLREKRLCKRVCSDIERLFGYDRLEVHASNQNDTLQVDVNDQPYRLDEHGAGLAQFLLVLVSAAVVKPAYVLIDEPELNLHPSLQLDFLTALGGYAEHGILFATHSIGLARAAADHIYSVQRRGDGSHVVSYDATPNLPEFLGALSYSSYQALGFTKVLLVEGPTEVRAVQQFLRKLGEDHRVLLLPLGGSSGIKERSEHELVELKRITPDLHCLIDSEKASDDAPLAKDRQAFVDVCGRLGIRPHVLERRAFENYLTDEAVKQVKGDKYRPLTPYEKRESVSPHWSKQENWKVAGEMKWDDVKDTDLGRFLDSL